MRARVDTSEGQVFVDPKESKRMGMRLVRVDQKENRVDNVNGNEYLADLKRKVEGGRGIGWRVGFSLSMVTLAIQSSNKH